VKKTEGLTWKERQEAKLAQKEIIKTKKYILTYIITYLTAIGF
jgi:hypothetical protein